MDDNLKSYLDEKFAKLHGDLGSTEDRLLLKVQADLEALENRVQAAVGSMEDRLLLNMQAALEAMENRVQAALEMMENRVQAALGSMEDRMQGDLVAVENRVLAKMRADLEATENRLIEKMRDMQTELLRGFEAFSSGQTVRLRKVEADQSNLDTSLRSRVDIVESRLTQIELRLGRQAS